MSFIKILTLANFIVSFSVLKTFEQFKNLNLLAYIYNNVNYAKCILKSRLYVYRPIINWYNTAI